jgi:hypothetical protein
MTLGESPQCCSAKFPTSGLRGMLGAYETPIDKMLSLPPQRGRLETRAG